VAHWREMAGYLYLREVVGLVGSLPACNGSSLGSNTDISQKFKNGRHNQRSGQHTQVRQKWKKTTKLWYLCTRHSLKFYFLFFQDSLWNVKHPNGDPMGLAAQGYGGYYGEPTQHQYTMQQQQQQYTYEEYAHYPHPEEYMNERNRAYFHHNGEQYAMPTKQQQRHRLDSDCKYFGILLLLLFSSVFVCLNL
jgi:hypothetical protein